VWWVHSAASTTILALTRGAFSAVICRSRAAGMRMSQSQLEGVLPPGQVGRPGKVDHGSGSLGDRPSPVRCPDPSDWAMAPSDFGQAHEQRAALLENRAAK